MRKYRIIKKTNYLYEKQIYDEAYFIEVKTFLFYNPLKWWPGTDINDDDWGKHYDYCHLKGWPNPIHETLKKFPKAKIVSQYDDGLIFFSLDVVKFFIDRVKAQDEFMTQVDNSIKHKKETKEEVIYLDEDKNEKKQVTKNTNIIDI
jgi:hypothetical protein